MTLGEKRWPQHAPTHFHVACTFPDGVQHFGDLSVAPVSPLEFNDLDLAVPGRRARIFSPLHATEENDRARVAESEMVL